MEVSSLLKGLPKPRREGEAHYCVLDGGGWDVGGENCQVQHGAVVTGHEWERADQPAQAVGEEACVYGTGGAELHAA